jgi:phosphonate transport system substrate-binding protein
VSTAPSLKPLPIAGPRKGPRWPWLARARLAVQAAVFAGFVVQGVLYYTARFRPLGNLLPFTAYESVGYEVVSSALLAWGALFLVTMVFGRLVCGWLCPLGFFQDAGERLLARLGVKLRRPVEQPRAARALLAAVVLGHFAVMPLLASPVRVWRLDLHFREPWLLGFPFRAGLFALDLALVFALIGIVLPLVFGPRPYCKLVCETGLLLDRAGAHALGRIRRNAGFERDVCISCQKCASVCPQGIDVFEEVHLFDQVVNTDCVACLRCVDACPVDVISYSLRKRVHDTGKAAGYLAARRARPHDLPRYALTAAGAAAGGWFGLVRLPPSTFHTYLLFASLGGLAGWLAWRGSEALAGGRLSEDAIAEMALSQVDRERARNLPPLSNKEKARLGPARAVRAWVVPAVALVLAAIAALVAGILASVPPRIGQLAEMPAARRTPAAREAEGVLHVGLAPFLSADELELAYGGLAGWLAPRTRREVRLFEARSYGGLAQAVEDGRLDAAIVPPAAYVALRRRGGAARAILQSRSGGRATYDALIVAREGGPAALGDLRGKRVAFTSLDSLSGYIAPVALLRASGISPADLGEAVLAGDHSSALALLAAGEVDAAATFDGALAAFRAKRPDAPLRALATIPDLPYDVVLVDAALAAPTAAALRGAFLDIARSPSAAPLRAGLARAGVDGFDDVDEGSFAAVERMIAGE